nr:uncharacterized protein LOC112030010 [Quercus suber]
MEDFFPALNIIRIDNSNIVSIPECISRLSSLYRIEINNCKELREIPRLPQSIRYVDTEKCPSLLPQSSSRLLNQFGKILGILPNGDILVDLFDDSESESASKSDSEFENVCLLVPGTEIPKSLKFNHQKFGNSVSFKVGRKFPDLAVCVAFRSAEAHIRRRELFVNVSINGYKQNFRKLCTRDSYEQLWLFSESLGHLKKPNLSEQNQVEVVVENASAVLRNQILLTCHFRVTGMVVGHPQL